MINVTTEEIEEYLVCLKEIIQNNGKVIIKRDRNKNFIFAYLYNYDDKAIKNQLLKIKNSDFEECLLSTEPNHQGDKLYVWTPSVLLTAADGESEMNKLYIKTHIDEKNRLTVISFHRYNDFS